MKERIDDILTEGKQGTNKVPRESVSKEEKKEKE